MNGPIPYRSSSPILQGDDECKENETKDRGEQIRRFLHLLRMPQALGVNQNPDSLGNDLSHQKRGHNLERIDVQIGSASHKP